MNHSVAGILIDHEISSDILHIGIFKKLGLHDRDLKTYEGKSLLAFKCEMVELPVSFSKRKDKRTVNVHFLMIPYENVYNDIIGRSFLIALD